jgi:hypothetical protein
MSNTASPLTIQGEEIQVGWKFQAGSPLKNYVVVWITLNSVGFETIDGRVEPGMTHDQFRAWLEPPTPKDPTKSSRPKHPVRRLPTSTNNDIHIYGGSPGQIFKRPQSP